MGVLGAVETAAITIKCTGTGVANNDIIQKHMRVSIG
jgi:hypothetical protein